MKTLKFHISKWLGLHKLEIAHATRMDNLQAQLDSVHSVVEAEMALHILEREMSSQIIELPKASPRKAVKAK